VVKLEHSTMADAAESGTSLQQAIKDKYCAKADPPNEEKGPGNLRSKSFEVGLAYRPGNYSKFLWFLLVQDPILLRALLL